MVPKKIPMKGGGGVLDNFYLAKENQDLKLLGYITNVTKEKTHPNSYRKPKHRFFTESGSNIFNYFNNIVARRLK